MHADRLHAVSRSRFAWLLWLALLVPIAQGAAAWHALSHAAQDARRSGDDGHPAHQSVCDLCLTAAALSGGALLGEPPTLAFDAMRHAVPQAALVAFWVASPARAYHSRAPPSASR